MLLASRQLSGNRPHRAWRGEPPGFSRDRAGSLDLRRGPQGPALVALGNASPHASCSGPLGIPLPSEPGPKTLCGYGAGTRGFLSSADMDIGALLKSPQGSQSSSLVEACTCAFLPSCSSSVMLPSRGSRDQCLSLEAFPRGFPKRLSHEAFPQGCPTCHRGVSRSSA